MYITDEPHTVPVHIKKRFKKKYTYVVDITDKMAH